MKHVNQTVVTSLDTLAEAKIRTAARKFQDDQLLLKIGDHMHGDGPDFTALEVKYHKTCYRNYLNKVRPPNKSKNSQLKKRASTALLKHVERLVINQSVPVLASSLLKVYKDLFLSYGGDMTVLEHQFS